MRVIDNDKFIPCATEDGTVYAYHSCIRVEIEGRIFETYRTMSVEEYESMYPALRDFIHNALRSNIMADIRKKLFEGVES